MPYTPPVDVERPTVAYREKTAWLALAALVVAFGPYFAISETIPLPKEAVPNLGRLCLYAGASVVQLLVLGIGHVLLRFQSPEEATAPADERDIAIKSRSIAAAYYVLIAGMIVVGVVLPFVARGWKIVNAALLMIVVAELVHFGVTVFSYRRDA